MTKATKKSRIREIAALALVFFSLFLFLSLISYSPADPSWTTAGTIDSSKNWCGRAGSYIADVFFRLFGIGGLLPVFVICPFGLALVFRPRKWLVVRLLAGIVVIFTLGLLFQFIFGSGCRYNGFISEAGIVSGETTFSNGTVPGHRLGGVIGDFLAAKASSGVGAVGKYLVVLFLMLIGAGICLNFSWLELWAWLKKRFKSWRTNRRAERLKKKERGKAAKAAKTAAIKMSMEESEETPKEKRSSFKWKRPAKKEVEEPDEKADFGGIPILDHSAGRGERDDLHDAVEENGSEPSPVDGLIPQLEEEETPPIEPVELVREPIRVKEAEKDKPKRNRAKERPGRSGESASKPSSFGENEIEDVDKEFVLPGVNILSDKPRITDPISEDEIRQDAEALLRTLNEFGINGQVTSISPGPVIIRYEFLPDPGVKMSRVKGLAEDIARGMKLRSTPNIEHVPGKSVLGIEVPRKRREVVYFKEIVGSGSYADTHSILKFALGKDIGGGPFVADLGAMPHLLIAGSTGSGKSVALNVMICSFLYNASPDDLQFIMIDPKMLELSMYNDIPHLMEPVVTDPKKASAALAWAVREMEDRYRRLAGMGVRNIGQYNDKVIKKRDSGDAKSEDEFYTMPYLVIVIDEFADLMMVASKDVEEAVIRLAQMARAAGIHLILATQRPSVDVITGVIKANMPCRIAFKVASKNDSRVILDSNGAENLLGKGDMIFMPPGATRKLRLHCAYLAEPEIESVVGFLKAQRKPVYTVNPMELIQPGVNEDDIDIDDELFDAAVKLVVTSQNASISMLQRRLRIGHSRAARLMDMMEINHIVGQFEGSKPREILIEEDQLPQILGEAE